MIRVESLSDEWMIERVHRCYDQIWDVSEQILTLKGNVVLDLGFTEKSLRTNISERALTMGIAPELHYLDASKEIRKQ